jgi:thiosulfate reductase cytochrome b subunit
MTYIGVVFLLIPMLIVTGLSLSPGFNAVWHFPLDLFGGRASARSLHFICAGLIGGFIVLHLVLVILAGPFNEVRSMITGKYRVPADPDTSDRKSPELMEEVA